TYRMDTVVGVAPFRKVDRVLEKIPLVGKILTGGDEGSLIINYYSVKGPFSGPAVQSVPLTSISKKLLGTFQGVLQTPRELFTHKESDSP
ncbi:MAG: hypothetical protein GWM98_07810, partial [Nitrospinaceae bacterium]|nr:hypothetical protein [Nitrospinaceae bacterium]NIR54423.1 hypothetical protein [Nitrospinaceae bacterium]NIS84837.1 hypothetical protein [Nitrospinaceae bacterium]NIT81642.1 hypothetical protein [Nitrospinaceae bacterium]NIU43925.1 hypothetical protein [Nitrospinaceae bacterium]